MANSKLQQKPGEMRRWHEGDPMVSILVPVYNHEPYIERCLRSVAMQKTEYSYEVLIGEDCSTDGSRELLHRLEKELPANFVFIYREKNMGGVANGRDLYARARGKYFAGLEGDDFWLYDGKLQEQVSFLEANPSYSAIYTNCCVVDEHGDPNGEKYPQCPEEEYSWREFFYSCLPGHHGTLMCRWPEFYAAYQEFSSMQEYVSYAGDRRNAFLLLSLGRVCRVQQEWSAYRHVCKDGASNWCSTVTFDEAYAKDELGFAKTLICWAERHGPAEAVLVAKKTYYRFLLKWSTGKRAFIGNFGSWLRAVMADPERWSCLMAPLQWYVVLGLRMLRGRSVDL